jgi:hypothetical protein
MVKLFYAETVKGDDDERHDQVPQQAACGSRGEKSGFNCLPGRGLVYTPIDREAKTEIPAEH